MKHVAIIGNGIAGITAARFIRKMSDFSITVISSESDYFFSRTALMYVYMGHMKFSDIKPYEDWFWEKNRIDLLREKVHQININDKSLLMDSGKQIKYDKLLIATGSQSNKLGWPGQDLDGVQGLYSLQDLERMETKTKNVKHAVIVGGGLIGIEMAEMLLSRNIPVTMLVREREYWDNIMPAQEAAMISNHIREHHVDLRLETELTEIIGDSHGKVKGVLTSNQEFIDCAFVGLTPGVHPNIELVKNTNIQTEMGILVNAFLETNVQDIYAAGDCVQLKSPPPGRQQTEAVWYVGKIQGWTAAHNICGRQKSYDPGIWYNSAKFFDIEYQVYGNVPRHPRQGLDSVFWVHPENRKSIRIVYQATTGIVEGFNLLGIRFRHEICDRWIREKENIEFVVQNLQTAFFEPEFSPEFSRKIKSVFKAKRSENLELLKAE